MPQAQDYKKKKEGHYPSCSLTPGDNKASALNCVEMNITWPNTGLIWTYFQIWEEKKWFIEGQLCFVFSCSEALLACPWWSHAFKYMTNPLIILCLSQQAARERLHRVSRHFLPRPHWWLKATCSWRVTKVTMLFFAQHTQAQDLW